MKISKNQALSIILSSFLVLSNGSFVFADGDKKSAVAPIVSSDESQFKTNLHRIFDNLMETFEYAYTLDLIIKNNQCLKDNDKHPLHALEEKILKTHFITKELIDQCFELLETCPKLSIPNADEYLPSFRNSEDFKKYCTHHFLSGLEEAFKHPKKDDKKTRKKYLKNLKINLQHHRRVFMNSILTT